MAHVVRPIGRSLPLITVVIAIACVAPLRAAAVAAQTAGDYRTLVEEYAHGGDQRAMTALARWPRPVVTSAVNSWASKLAPDELIAAAMLHTELGAKIVDDTPSLASFHVGTARHLIDVLMAGGRGHERGLVVKRRWYEFVVSLYTSRARLAEAERFALDGLADFPRDAVLWVSLGAIQELRVGFDEPDLRAIPRPDNSRISMRLTRSLESAASDFRRALAIDNGLATAHMHLGWVHFIVHDDRAADDLRAALAHATDDGTRCLAHLFLGAVAERDRKLNDARQEYEAAQAVGAAYQTPFVALIRVEEELGHHARARELAEAFTALPVMLEDPWWDFHLGSLDLAALAWLRHEAQGH